MFFQVLPGVDALVDAVAVTDGALRLILAGAQPDDVGILGSSVMQPRE
jgi:hypothetical protein